MRNLLAVAILAAGSVLAAPISYQESVGGDLPDLADAVSIFVLDLGSNTVSGQISSEVDFDNFAVEIPVGMRLDSITLQGTGTVQMQYMLAQGFTSKAASVDYVAPAIVTLTHLSAPGTYLVRQVRNASPKGFGPTDYTWTFNVSSTTAATPEPASIGLAGMALLGLIAARRRK